VIEPWKPIEQKGSKFSGKDSVNSVASVRDFLLRTSEMRRRKKATNIDG
jgi:hypothetical protein